MFNIIRQHLLTILIFFPLAGTAVLSVIGRKNVKTLKYTCFTIFVLEALLSLPLYFFFNNTGVIDQFVVDIPWIETLNIHYLVGIDGVSLFLILVTTFTMPLTLLGTWNSVEKNLKFYLLCLTTLQAGMVGVFCALDLFLFYLFWEAMLIPMYFLIGVWGGQNRIYATLKFFIYTMAGSIVMLVGLIFLYVKTGKSFNLFELYNYKLHFIAQCWVFAALAFAFAIKVPLFPFHTWLPDAHVEAPTAGSVILAGILLKMGAYGFFRFAIPLFPDATLFLKPYLMAVAVIGIVYGALVAMVQTDIKRLIAFSSVSHMGVVMLGLFSLNPTAMTGGLYQMLNHAVSTGSLFLLFGMLYDRSHKRLIADYSGLANLMPVYAACFTIVALSSIGVPLTNGFIGEFLTLTGSFQISKIMTVVATTSVIFSAVYLLWLIERVFFGPVKNFPTTDLNLREMATLGVMMFLIFWMGVYPKPFLEKIERSAQTVLYKLDDEREVAQR